MAALLSWLDSMMECMQVTLEVNSSEAAARIVKARLERTMLGQVAKRIRATLRPVSVLAVRTLCLVILLTCPVLMCLLIQDRASIDVSIAQRINETAFDTASCEGNPALKPTHR